VIKDLSGREGLKLVAAGGIATVAHLVRLARIGLEATVVGKALYTNDIDLPEAINAVKPSIDMGSR